MATQPLILAESQPQPKVIRMPRKRTRQARSRLGYLNSDQLARLLKAARDRGNREWAWILFALAHGARASEICNLRLADLNFKQGTVHIARLKGSLDSVQNLLRVKGNSLFNEEAAFRAWLAERQPDAADYVFNSRKSTKLTRQTIFRLFAELCEAAGIEDRSLWHPHVLKHSCAMALVEKNVNAFLIRQQLGHKSFGSTLQYVNPSDRQASDAAARAFSEIF
jgi:type 1 fimbriae regulatory protein FimB